MAVVVAVVVAISMTRIQILKKRVWGKVSPGNTVQVAIKEESNVAKLLESARYTGTGDDP